MNVGLAGDRRGWRVGRNQNQLALESVLRGRTYVRPWAQFLYAEGGDDEARLVFATHNVIVKGTGLSALLDDLAGEGLVGLDEPSRADRVGNGAVRAVRELWVEKAGGDH
jgi:hypothetical protein